jgi:dihydrofolate synthase/folylpolyglutamate synthase
MRRTLVEWLSWLTKFQLSSQSPEISVQEFFQTQTFAKQLGITQFSCPVITVGGTNGKGSCAVLLESIFLSAGYRVGMITSPHLINFNERLRLQGKSVSEEKICQAFEKIQSLSTFADKPVLSFYRFIHLAFLWLIHSETLEVCILEVGLGGQYDTINVVNNDLAIITGIDLDHTDILGETREEIAREKAGIMRPHKSVICGDSDPPHCLKEIAQQKNCVFYQQGKDFYAEQTSETWKWVSHQKTIHNFAKPSILLQNAATGLMAVMAIAPVLPVTEEDIRKGLQQIHLRGRCELIPATEKYPALLLDVSHNPQGVRALAEKIKEIKHAGRKLAIFGVMKDKDIMAILNTMIPIIDEWYLADLPNLPRAAKSKEIAKQLQKSQLRYAGLPEQCFQKAVENAALDDMIIVFGSFHVVGSILKWIKD